MLKIDDFNELSALHKAVLAAKFGRTADDPLSGDPTFAGLANRIYDELAKHRDNKLIGADAYEELRRVKTSQGFRGQWRTAVMTARGDSSFMSADHASRIMLAKCYLSPFSCTDEELEQFISETDRVAGEKTVDRLFRENDFSGAMLFGCSCDYSGAGSAHIVLGLKNRRTCDVFFSGVRAFRISREGDAGDDIPVLKKHITASGSIQKLDLSFAAGTGKEHIVIEADSVDYWV
ncbi:MAG: hypothetical protein J6O50_02360 [Ruminiclostridium sp.]|nr:hypothetical protein [Ruminiclostridium sp.]